jgi:hypothetical protein
MKSEQDILAALRALAESDREKEAPGEVEARLRAAFRRKHAARLWKRPAVWAMAAAAAGVLMIANYSWQRMALPPKPPPVTQAPSVAPAPAVPVAEVARVEPKPARRQVAKRGAPPPREIVTEFFPLVDVAPAFERGELVRVNLPASAMRTVGLPVREDRLSDRVQADVLVGQEGMPRAIRFVKYSQ